MGIEILSPVGSLESIYPAVRMGANAVYLGLKSFSARNHAENFDYEELEKAVKYCHDMNVKVYVAMNTLIRDDETEQAIRLADMAVKLNADAFIIQDMGLFSLLKKRYPSMIFHASTQTSVHTKYGMSFLYDTGFKRAVLPRELSKKEITEIVNSCPIETEVFVHGALCVCFSGQCYMSAILGTRSANRGICAGSCRLPFRVENEKNNYALSLKDNSIIENIKELENIGVTSAKIEGRMKRPEYVAISTKACVEALSDSLKNETKDCLRAVFSRDGFTSGYYDGRINADMFGKREKRDVISADKKTLSKIRNLYKDEKKAVGVDFELVFDKEKIILFAKDQNGNTADVSLSSETDGGYILSREKIENQLKKTGNTCFYVKNIKLTENKIYRIRLSTLNRLRREALDILFEKRSKRNTVSINENFITGEFKKSDNKQKKPGIRLFLDKARVNESFKKCEMIYIPMFTDIKKTEKLLSDGYKIAVHLPRFSQKTDSIIKRLELLKNIGINDAWGGTIDSVELIKKVEMNIHGGFGLNIFNSYSLEFFKNMGLSSAELSPELKFSQIKAIAQNDIKIKKGIIVYGHIPLMLLRNCPVKFTKYGCKGKNNRCHGVYLTDRLNKQFKVNCCGEYVEILNSDLLDVRKSFQHFNCLDFFVFRIDVENTVEMFENSELFNMGNIKKIPKTSGLYIRGVE